MKLMFVLLSLLLVPAMVWAIGFGIQNVKTQIFGRQFAKWLGAIIAFAVIYLNSWDPIFNVFLKGIDLDDTSSITVLIITFVVQGTLYGFTLLGLTKRNIINFK